MLQLEVDNLVFHLMPIGDSFVEGANCLPVILPVVLVVNHCKVESEFKFGPKSGKSVTICNSIWGQSTQFFENEDLILCLDPPLYRKNPISFPLF